MIEKTNSDTSKFIIKKLFDTEIFHDNLKGFNNEKFKLLITKLNKKDFELIYNKYYSTIKANNNQTKIIELMDDIKFNYQLKSEINNIYNSKNNKLKRKI